MDRTRKLSARMAEWLPAFRNALMRVQDRLKLAVKPLFIEHEPCLRVIRHGPAKGARLYLNRMTDLQREFGLWETELNDIYRVYVPGRIVYDIGAADGLTALAFACLGAPKVIAFEPAREAAATFELNMRANSSLALKIKLLRTAVGHDPLSDLPTPGFVKIDVDGAELDVLESLEMMLRLSRAPVVVEVHSRDLENRCSEKLRQLGYTVHVVRNAWWRTFYPEHRPIEHNRWLFAKVGERPPRGPGPNG
jgi:predicted RNA methylase